MEVYLIVKLTAGIRTVNQKFEYQQFYFAHTKLYMKYTMLFKHC